MANKYTEIIERLGGSDAESLDEAHLLEVEAQLGFNLPSNYREFLRDFGGVSFSDAVFPMYQENRWENARLSMFHGSSDEGTLADAYHEQLNFYEALEDDHKTSDFEWYSGIHLVRDTPVPVRNLSWPKELLPIGSDPGGNPICLALFGLRPGAIFWWRNSPFEGRQNLYLVADSFNKFMNLLTRGE